MIKFPPGFDYSQLMSDFFAFALPFIGIAFLFGAASVIRKAINQAG